MKQCSKCKTVKCESDFYTLNGKLRAACKACHILANTKKSDSKRRASCEATKRWQKRNPLNESQRAERAAYAREWRVKNSHRINSERNAKRAADPKTYRKQQNDWCAKNPHRKMFTSAKARAKKSGLAFTISLEDILPLPDRCPVLGIELRKGISSDDPNSYSLDRIDNTKGYVPGNVVVMSRRANVLKRDATYAELQALTRWLESTLTT